MCKFDVPNIFSVIEDKLQQFKEIFYFFVLLIYESLKINNMNKLLIGKGLKLIRLLVTLFRKYIKIFE